MKSHKALKPSRFAVALSLGLVALSGAALGAGPGSGGGGGGGGGGGQPPSGETAASNVSFPVILSDNASPSAFPVDGAWRFANITDPATQCVGEEGVTTGVVPTTTLCYYGRHVTVVSETGTIEFDGDPKVWWLQKRPENFWKAFSIAHQSADTPLAVSAVDIGDLLESTPSIATRQIRTEFNLLQTVSAEDTELGPFLVNWSDPASIAKCTVPTAAGQSVGCYAAVAMSGAVPGTEQSGNEAQGTDFGPGGAVNYPGTRTFIDPRAVRAATDEGGNPVPVDAIVYSHCARLVVQKIAGTPTWNPATGQWSGTGVGAPVVNVAAYNNTYSAEINSGGGLVYGYNWNAKTAATGTYRLTFVLDGNDTSGPQCSVNRTTEFKWGVTKLVNVGESNKASIIYAGETALNGGDEGGLVYIDLTLTGKGGGKKGGGKPSAASAKAR